MYLLVYTPRITPRLQYTWEVLLNYTLRAEFFLTSDLAVYSQPSAGKINYSNQRLFEQEVFIPKGNLLSESDIRPQSLQVFQYNGLPAFFQQEAPGADLPFDLPALVFYLISRYEEYLPFEADAHGRFEAAQSIGYQHHFLRRPLVNEWALQLCIMLQQYFPTLKIAKPTYQFTPTYDLDLAWAYGHRGWLRNAGGYVRDWLKGDFQNVRRRWRVQTGQEEDPFFSFNYLNDLHKRFNLIPNLFVLLGDYGKFDKNIDHRHAAFRQLIQQLHLHYQLGIHPSYGSNKNSAQLHKEVERLVQIIGEPIVRSRQHFLKLRLPHTYQKLMEANIIADYSLGYASDIGFRAGIANPYPWYDLSKEETTTLLLYPFQVMDVTLKDYLKYNPQEAVAAVAALIEKIRAVGGTFCPLWHNSSFSELEVWSEWRGVYEEIIEIATQAV